ncbi:MAG: hypothetical protein JWQ26_3168 [Modestobacter sp.]|nr:hypothetical protein [Modestobacter sp.]
MPEPLDTIRRVNSDQPMSVDELQRACAVLDRHSRSKKTDVLQARRRAEERLVKLTGASAPSAVRQVPLHDAIYSGSQRPPKQPQTGGNALGGFVVLLLIVAAVIYGCTRLGGDDSSSSSGSSDSAGEVGEVSRAEFEGEGRTWPLTVDRGTLDCEPANRVIFTADGTTYAVNGTAKGAGEWPDIDPIWADDGSGLGLKVDIGDLIGAGLALCE